MSFLYLTQNIGLFFNRNNMITLYPSLNDYIVCLLFTVVGDLFSLFFLEIHKDKMV